MRFFLWILSSVLIIIIAGCSQKFTDYTEQEGIQEENTTQSRHNNLSEFDAGNIYGPSHPSYDIKVKYDSENHEISGSMNIQFTNNLDKTLKEIYFNLWPKADDFVDGDIGVSNVRYNGDKVDINIDGTHLKVSGFSLSKNEHANVSMTFTVKIPHQQHRFGWDGTSVSLGNWFPILAVYDDDGWNLYPYFEAGESFYSLIGDYDVTLTTNDKMVVAATGKQIGSIKKSNGQVTHHFRAQNVRDFAIQMNSNYHVVTEIVDDIKMNIYYTKEQGRYKGLIIDSGRQTLEILNKKIGPYAWDELHIVGIDCEFGGMEYPQLVMICMNENFNQDYIKTVVAHEIGHQWFYSAIGNNQFKEPWLDEAFAAFMEVLGTDGLKSLNDEKFKEPENPYRLDSSVSTFAQQGDKGNEAYYEFIYNYGLNTLNDLRKELGDDAFYKGMRQYYQNMKFNIATTSDFIRIMEEATGEDLKDFFEEHFIKVD